jgi:hypothetical protein
MEKKWTDGKPYERSRRLKHVQEIENNEFTKEVENSAYSSSLHHDENTWEILNNSLSNSGLSPLVKETLPLVKVSNKREELDLKMADRGLTQQIGFNPFLGDNSYIDDVSIRDQFLKPLNTTQGETKSKNLS